MANQIGAPAAGKQTGATDNSITESLSVNDTTYDLMLGDYPPVGTPEQVAGVLQLSKQTVRDMCRSGQLSAIKCGPQWRIPRQWLIQFINNGGR